MCYRIATSHEHSHDTYEVGIVRVLKGKRNYTIAITCWRSMSLPGLNVWLHRYARYTKALDWILNDRIE